MLKRSMDRGLEAYHYVFIDCPPSLGLLTVNALLTATEVYIPIAMTYFALEGVEQVMHTINAVKRSLDHPNLAITGVIATFFDGRTRLSHRFLRISAPISGMLSFRQLSARMSSWTKPSLTINLFLTTPLSRRVHRIRQSC